MQQECPHGPTIRKGLLREQYGLKKQCLAILDERKVAHTITTLPDDLLHYSEPRILTVRECARLQSFPDWFRFQGNYTTGGKRRTHECPRYTQVGNAVPPLLAEALGRMLRKLALEDTYVSNPEGGSNGHRERQPVG
jgi:DNA (cytosine-5)-methyltransferase 1